MLISLSGLSDVRRQVVEADLIHYILFMLCTFIIAVMLLNMLIAVISDTYARINEHKDAASVKARAGSGAKIKDK